MRKTELLGSNSTCWGETHTRLYQLFAACNLHHAIEIWSPVKRLALLIDSEENAFAPNIDQRSEPNFVMTMTVDPLKIAAVLPNSRWIGSRLAHAQIAIRNGEDSEEVARNLYESSNLTLTRSREITPQLKSTDLANLLEPRKKRGSAENPITKMFPAAVTERQFLDKIESLQSKRTSVNYSDERFDGHTLVDFSLLESDLELPINVKNAGTRFENAQALVGLDSNDCVPIPAYKAYDAIEKKPNLLYAMCVDYALIGKIETQLLTRLNHEESHVWEVLNEFAGPLITDAEDIFVYSTVNRHWDEFSKHVSFPVFRVISARKAIRILQIHPKRTPGVGLKAWGTGANGETNVHISISSEMTPWDEIESRIASNGIDDIIAAVNRKKTEVVFDPEI